MDSVDRIQEHFRSMKLLMAMRFSVVRSFRFNCILTVFHLLLEFRSSQIVFESMTDGQFEFVLVKLVC